MSSPGPRRSRASSSSRGRSNRTGTCAARGSLRSIPLLDQSAIDAVMRWRFTPAKVNEVAVPVIMTLTVNFMLQ